MKVNITYSELEKVESILNQLNMSSHIHRTDLTKIEEGYIKNIVKNSEDLRWDMSFRQMVESSIIPKVVERLKQIANPDMEIDQSNVKNAGFGTPTGT